MLRDCAYSSRRIDSAVAPSIPRPLSPTRGERGAGTLRSLRPFYVLPPFPHVGGKGQRIEGASAAPTTQRPTPGFRRAFRRPSSSLMVGRALRWRPLLG